MKIFVFFDFPKLHYVKSSCMELASELGLSQSDINSNEIDIKTVNEVIKCLIFPKNKSEASYYSSHYKNYFFSEHLPFIGMDDLGCQLLHEAINNYFDNVKSFDQLIKVICSIHGTGVIEANSIYLSDASFENKITSSDDLYLYLLKAQLNKDDALLICRETRLCQKEYLSPLIISKLKEVGEDDKFISFLQCVQKLFYKGQVVATARVDMLFAKIYLNDPMRYYRAFFNINDNWVIKINDDCNFVKEYEIAKYKTYRDIYLGAIDLEERGYNPKQLIKEIKSSRGIKLD